VFNQLGFSEVAVLLIVALFVLGPERLPGLAADAGRLLRSLRTMARGVTDDLKAELGPEMGDLDLASLHPKRFVHKHLFEDDDDDTPPPPRRPSGSVRSSAGTPGPPRASANGYPLRREATGSGSARDAAPYDPDAT